MTETKLPGMVFNKIDTKKTYDALVKKGEIGENDLCLVEDEDNISPGSGTGASVGDIIKVKAVDDSGKPTAWEAVAAEGSSDGWTKIGELTMGGTIFPISAYADGVITVTPQNGVYPTTNHNRIARKEDYSSYILIRLYATETAGQFTMKNFDNQTYAPTDVDLTQYIIEEPDAETLTFSSIAPYTYHKVRAVMPLMACHGMRSSFTGLYAYPPLHVGNMYAYQLGRQGCEVNFETCSSYSADKIATKASWISALKNSGTYDLILTNSKPSSPPASLGFFVESAMLSIGTRVELWGRNDED